MSEQIDDYSLYEHAYSKALVYRERLIEHEKLSELDDDEERLRAERRKIADDLQKLTIMLGISSSELTDQVESTWRQRPTARALHIDDPLSLAELDSDRPMRHFLDDIIRARSHSNWQETLHLCNNAVRCGTEHGNQAGIATTLLYLADAQAQAGCLKGAIATAERARRLFRIQRDYHNTIVTHLLLARFRARQSLDDAKPEYLEALSLCRELEAEARETARNKKALSYGQMIEEIERTLECVDAGITEQLTRRALPLPAGPKFGEGPDMALSRRLHSKVMEYVTIGEFTIKGRKYHLYPLDQIQGDRFQIKPGDAHFALPAPENGWPDLAIQESDYILVRQEVVAQEGLGVLWMGEKWVAGRFERDATSGSICFVPQEPSFIGIPTPDHSVALLVVALLKPVPSSDPLLILNKQYRLLVDVLPSDPSDFTEEFGQLSVIGEPGQPSPLDLITRVRLPHRMVGIDVTVRAEDMEVSPHWVQSAKPSEGQDWSPLGFTLTPRQIGHKQVEVEFYYRRHWLRRIRFSTKVVGPDE